jgi:arginyl-tRNA synthetase
LDQFPTIIENSAKAFSPAQLANFIYELAKAYNKFYHEESILKSDDQVEKEFRLKLSSSTAFVIERGMKLLGISVPERM